MTTRSHLLALENAGLVQVGDTRPELNYLFRHGLIQASAYATLVRQARRSIHQAVGEVLEQDAAERPDDAAAVLAQHFALAGDDARALRYFTRAGDAAARNYANAEAIAHYTQALTLAGRAPEAAPQLRHLYSQRGRALELVGRFDAALANAAEMLAAAVARADRRLELAALIQSATLRSTPQAFDAAEAEALNRSALDLSLALTDREAECQVHWNLLLLHTFTGDLVSARSSGEAALALARELGLGERAAFAQNDLASVYWSLGDLDRAGAALTEARRYWEQARNLPMLVDSLGNAAFVALVQGAFAEGVEHARAGLAASRSIGNLYGQCFTQAALASLLFEQGNFAPALEAAEEVQSVGEGSQVVIVQSASCADLAWMYASLGACVRARALEQRALVGIAQPQPAAFQVWALASLARQAILCGDLAAADARLAALPPGTLAPLRVYMAPYLIALAQAELALARGSHISVLDGVEPLLAQCDASRAHNFVAEALCLRGRACLALGRIADARAAFRSAQAQANRISQWRTEWVALVCLAQLEAEVGDEQAAAAWRDAARPLISTLADSLPAELKVGFLSLPLVQSGLESASHTAPTESV